MKNRENQPAIIAASTGLALCLGLGSAAVASGSAAELSNGGSMVKSVSGNDAEFVELAGMGVDSGKAPEQPVSKPWGDLRFDGCSQYGSIFWSGATGIANTPEDPAVNITTEVEWIADGKAYNSQATTWPLGYSSIHQGNTTSYSNNKGQVVGARMRYVAADNPSKATRCTDLDRC